MKQQTLLILILLVNFSFISFGYNSYAISSSLQNEIDSTSSDILKSHNYIKLCKHLVYTKPDSALYFGFNALKIAKQLKNDSLQLQSHYHLATAKFLSNNLPESMAHLDKALIIAKTSNSIKYSLRTHNLKGIIQTQQGDYHNAVNNLQIAIEFAKTLHDTIALADIYQNLGGIYATLNENSLSKLIYQKSHNLLKTQDSTNYDVQLALINNEYNLTILKEDSLDKKNALLTVYTKITRLNPPYYDLQSNVLNYLGSLCTDLKQFDEAELYYKKKLQLDNKLNRIVPSTHLCLIKNLIQNNKIDRAAKQLASFLPQIDSLNNDSLLQHSKLKLDFYLTASNIYQKQKKYQKAHQMLIKHIALSESLTLRKREKLLAEFGKKFELEQKEQKIKIANLQLEREKNENNKRTIIAALCISFLLLLFIISFYFLRKQRKNTLATLQKEIEINEFRTAFMENTAHDIRTPISLVIGYIELSKKTKQDDKTALSYLDTALQNCSQILHFTNEILLLIKTERNDIALNLTQQSLNDFIENTYYLHRAKAMGLNIKQHYTSNISNSLMISFDFKKLEQILNNLIDNAIKYSPCDSKIMLALEISKSELIIQITDEGIGMSKEEIDQIFSRYYSTKRVHNPQGIGIGLSLVQNLVNFLNGTIEVESQTGVGSTFKVTLPVNITNLEPHIKKIKTRMPEAQDTPPLNNEIKPKIMVVDDNKSMLNYLNEILHHTYNCTLISNTETAIEKLKLESYDLIISDLIMPSIDGYEFKTQINAIHEHETTPFIIITGDTKIDTKIKGFTFGINEFLTKPFDERELLVRIENLLKNQKVREKHLKLNYSIQENIVIDKSKSHKSQFINQLTDIIIDNLDNEQFKVQDLARESGLSQRQLSRKLNEILGMSPVKFILDTRLIKAYEILSNKMYPTIKECMYAIGINSAPYFNKKFTERFGITPRALLKKED